MIVDAFSMVFVKDIIVNIEDRNFIFYWYSEDDARCPTRHRGHIQGQNFIHLIYSGLATNELQVTFSES